VRLVIADTSPINYLLLIGHIEILPALFERVILPAAVCEELKHPKAPLVVRNWVAAPPSSVDVRPSSLLKMPLWKPLMQVKPPRLFLRSSFVLICC
jgi:hypothetical protein